MRFKWGFRDYVCGTPLTAEDCAALCVDPSSGSFIVIADNADGIATSVKVEIEQEGDSYTCYLTPAYETSGQSAFNNQGTTVTLSLEGDSKLYFRIFSTTEATSRVKSSKPAMT